MNHGERNARLSLTFTILAPMPLFAAAATGHPAGGGAVLLAFLFSLVAIGFLMRGAK